MQDVYTGLGDLTVLLKVAPTDPCCHDYQLVVFEQRIVCKSACVRGTAQIVAPKQRFSRSASYNDVIKIHP